MTNTLLIKAYLKYDKIEFHLRAKNGTNLLTNILHKKFHLKIKIKRKLEVEWLNFYLKQFSLYQKNYFQNPF